MTNSRTLKHLRLFMLAFILGVNSNLHASDLLSKDDEAQHKARTEEMKKNLHNGHCTFPEGTADKLKNSRHEPQNTSLWHDEVRPYVYNTHCATLMASVFIAPIVLFAPPELKNYLQVALIITIFSTVAMRGAIGVTDHYFKNYHEKMD